MVIAETVKSLKLTPYGPALQLRARRQESLNSGFRGFTQDYVDAESVFIEIILKPEDMYPFKIKEFKDHITKQRLLCFKGNQKQIAKEIDGERVALGDEYRTNKINLTVKPVGMSALDYAWPRHIEYTSKSGKHLSLAYRLGSSNDELTKKLKIKLC